MNKVLALVVCLCVGAMATPINLSGSNGEQTLQEILDSLTVGPVQGVSHYELQIAPYKAGICGFNEYIFAWEDLPINGADGDYNDMIVLVESIRPVPEPATLSFLGIGLLSLFSRGLIRRKRT